MKKNLFLFSFALFVYTVTAQTVVKDSVTGSPVAQASVLNERGLALGQTNMEGLLPDLKGAKSISISHIGYAVKKVRVVDLEKELLLSPVIYPVREVVKEMDKPHCLRLKCYMRKYMLNDCLILKKDTVDAPPIISFTDEICYLYLFDDESINLNKSRSLVKRNVLSQTQVKGRKEYLFSTSMTSYLEKAKQNIKKGTMEVRGDTCRQELYRVKKDKKYRQAVVVRDTVNKTILVDVDHLAPKGSLTVNLGIVKTQRLVDTESFVYRLSGYEKVGQSELLAYRSVVHEKDRSLGIQSILPLPILPNATIDQWKFVEFYPFEAEFLTHKEYKEDKKEVKDSEMPLEEIDRIKKEINVPALSPEIEQKLSETMQWIEKHKNKESSKD